MQGKYPTRREATALYIMYMHFVEGDEFQMVLVVILVGL